MAKTCKGKFQFLEDLDLFGKDAELYYKGKSKRSSFIGIAFTIIYCLIYFGAFLYLLITLLKKYDISFYDSYAFNGVPPNITLTPDVFYGGFALGNPLTMQTYVDDSIYYVKAEYKRGIKNGKIWKWETIPLELETCNIEKFGEKYRDIFKDKSVEKLHCIKNLNYTLEGHTTYDAYSYFHVSFFPCVNDAKCKDVNIVRQYLTQTFVTFKMEDIDLTPQIYNSPVALRGKEVTANVWANLFQDVHSYFQVINIETDQDINGFELSPRTKKEKYIKYDQSIILNSLIVGDIFVKGGPICNVTVALSEKELTQRRTYKKLIELMGDLGGIMEVILSLFKLISIVLTETLYETSLINHLFSFDINRKVIIIKEKKNLENKIEDNSPKINNLLKNRSTQYSINLKDDQDKYKNKIIDNNNDNITIKSRKINEGPKTKKKIIKKKKLKSKKKNIENKSNNTTALKSIINAEVKTSNNILETKTRLCFMNKGSIFKANKIKDKQEGILNKVKMNKICLYLCFCCARKRKNIQNILIDEGMKVIKEYLDIINIFKKIHKLEKMKENNEIKEEIIEMTEECKNNLSIINKKCQSYN